MTVSPWWAPHVHADRRPFLLGRARITAALRAWFRARDFVEVETAILQVSPGNEAHLHAFATELIGADGQRAPLYLHTSPEFACKKLLAAGEPRIFTFARVFRNRERGAAASSRVHHAGMVPGGRALRRADGRLRGAAAPPPPRRPARRRFAYRGRAADPFAAPERLTVAEAFAPLRRHRSAGDARRRATRSRALRRPGSGHPRRRRRHLVRHLQPRAGRADRAASSASAAPTILDEYPVVGGRAGAADARTIRASPSASSFMPAASSSPTRSAN